MKYVMVGLMVCFAVTPAFAEGEAAQAAQTVSVEATANVETSTNEDVEEALKKAGETTTASGTQQTSVESTAETTTPAAPTHPDHNMPKEPVGKYELIANIATNTVTGLINGKSTPSEELEDERFQDLPQSNFGPSN